MKIHKFESKILQSYSFSWGKLYGYDRQGNIWEDEEFEIRKKKEEGEIVIEYRQKIVFYEKVLIGRLRECLDKTWMAHSPYNDAIGDLEIFGFANEFYAVRYLHQVALAVFPVPTVNIPDLPLN